MKESTSMSNLKTRMVGKERSSAAVKEYLRLIQINSDHGHEVESSDKQQGVVFKDIEVVGGDAGIIYQDTVTTRVWRALNFVLNLLSNKKPARRTILHGISGALSEGEMLLVLGRPGSGCTTLLKTLAGMTESFHGWTGDISYWGLPVDIIKKIFRGNVVYNAEGDVHFPHLTVLQTLGFAVNTKNPFKIPNRKEHLHTVVNTILEAFGLEATIATSVGNEVVPGVSGGERKRVSLAEVLSTHAKVTLWDNSTQGLDSSNSVHFAEVLHEYTKSGNNIAIAALYQASDDLVNIFDKITILHEGKQIFFGTLIEAEEYFSSLGFEKPERQTLSEFLVSVTESGLYSTKDDWFDRVPRSVEDFMQCWRRSPYYAKFQEDIEAQQTGRSPSENFEKKRFHKQPLSPNSEPAAHLQAGYILSSAEQLSVTFERALQRLRGDKPLFFASIFVPTFVALIFGSAFYNTPDTTQGFFSRQGVIFFGVLFNTIQTLAEVATQYSQRPIVQKQQSFAMYHPGIDAISSMVSLWPMKMITVMLFDLVLYFMANLKREPGAFFIFVLITYITSLMMCSLFRFIAAINKHEATAMSIVGVLILPLVMYTGYVIPTTSMHPWFKWITYINPLSYAFEALMANEFHAREVPCSNLIPIGPWYQNISSTNQVCPVTGSVPGSTFVSGDRYIAASFDYYHSHLWRNFAILVAFFVFFLVAYGIAVEYVPQVEKGRGDVLIWIREGAKSRKTQPEPAIKMKAKMTRTNSLAFAGLDRSEKSFTWSNIKYDIPVRGESKTLLAGINGFVKPGTMTALIGESGAGKTTLLNVLSQRTQIGTVKGEILINGEKLGNNFKRQTGFVESQDVHMSESTVRETLRFSAQLRQPPTVTVEEKYEYVERIIEILEMHDYADAVIGIPGSGLNLEQRKRMTVGIELVAKPSLIFLDEPTSGLDSQSSWSIIKCLRKLADSGQAILCTIHQPSSSLFELFDRVLLLQKGGRCAYFGQIGPHSTEVLEYFEVEGAAKCSPKTNPAEYLLRVTSTKREDSSSWADVWEKSDQAKLVANDLAILSHPQTSKDGSAPAEHNHTKVSKPSLFYQYMLVQKRSFQFYWRSPVYIHGKVLLNVAAGLFLGFTFYKEKDSAQGLQNKMFATFASLILSAPLMNQMQPRFFQVRELYQTREEPSKMYHWSIFVASIVVTEILTNFYTGTLFFIPWFFAVGFSKNFHNNSGRSAYMWIVFMMYEMWVSTFGQLLAALAPNAQIGGLLIPISFVFVVLFCGVLQPLSQLVKFWHFVHYASPFTWLVEGLFTTVLHNTTVTCTSRELNILQPPSAMSCGQFMTPFLSLGIGTIYNPNATSDCEFCRYKDGDQYLKGLSMSWDHRWRDFGFMWAYVAFNVGMILVVAWLPRWLRGEREKAARD
ncbi:putative ABC multidrug transporter [Tricladium varicosporioides]|nr:putative ABC multidrug transporter [Hymenoscyphus varicosporioides]